MWHETKDWHGKHATKTYMFFKAVVSEIRNMWAVFEDGEFVIGGNEVDYGTAKHKADMALLALTDGTA